MCLDDFGCGRYPPPFWSVKSVKSVPRVHSYSPLPHCLCKYLTFCLSVRGAQWTDATRISTKEVSLLSDVQSRGIKEEFPRLRPRPEIDWHLWGLMIVATNLASKQTVTVPWWWKIIHFTEMRLCVLAPESVNLTVCWASGLKADHKSWNFPPLWNNLK